MWDQCVQFCFHVCQQTRRLALVAAAVVHFQKFLMSFFWFLPCSLFTWRENYFPEGERTRTATPRGYDLKCFYLLFQTDHSDSVERMGAMKTSTVNHFSRTILRQPGRLRAILCVVILTATQNAPSSLFCCQLQWTDVCLHEESLWPDVWRTLMRQREMNELIGTKQPITFDKLLIPTLLAQVLSAFLIHCMCNIYGFFFTRVLGNGNICPPPILLQSEIVAF